MVERLNGIEEVRSSSLLGSTNLPPLSESEAAVFCTRNVESDHRTHREGVRGSIGQGALGQYRYAKVDDKLRSLNSSIPPRLPTTPSPRRLSWLLLSSFGLFVLACCLPALEFEKSSGPNDTMFGLRALAVGWSGFFAAIFAWFANPLAAISAVFAMMRKPTISLALAIVAVVLAGTTFQLLGRELPADEGNVTKMTVIKLLPGCYVWMTSIALLAVDALFRRFESRRTRLEGTAT